MSDRYERDTASSYLLSAAGGWLALGTGVAVLLFAFVSVFSLVQRDEKSEQLEISLSTLLPEDLGSSELGSLVVSDDGRRLHFTKFEKSGEKRVVSYFLSAPDDILFREISGSGPPRALGYGRGFRFRFRANLLETHWIMDHKEIRDSWAVSRWGKS